MKTFVFTGPTLSPSDAQGVLDAIYLPPASQGDVYRAARERPWAIGVIDGYFERVPAVSHKEILWALSRGIHVFGASSMGALRAAELAPFGMVGVGRVFEAFRDGELEDDDEVAVVHGPAESGYVSGSEAMVNIRATLNAADMLAGATRTVLTAIAKGLHYSVRSWARVLEEATAKSLPEDELDALREWLPGGRVDVKRRDAILMLGAMRAYQESTPEPFEPRFTFQHTDAWERLRRDAVLRPLGGSGSDTYLPDAVREELALLGDEAAWMHQGAWIRAMALQVAAQRGWNASDRDAEEAFRDRVATDGAATVGVWCTEQGLTSAEARRVLRDESQLDRIQHLLAPEALRALPDHLRVRRTYAKLEARAKRKQEVLAARGLVNPALVDAGVTAAELWSWYFGERLAQPVPPDLLAYANRIGLSSEAALRVAVLREYLFVDGRRENRLSSADSVVSDGAVE